MNQLLFPDFSEWNTGIDFTSIRRLTPVVAARVAYGTRLDKTMPGRIQQIRDAKFELVFYYLFLRATQDTTAQVKTVTDALGQLQPNEFVVIDFESDAGSTPSVAQRDDAAARFEAVYHKPTIIYCNLSMAKANPTNRFLWVASYGGVTEPNIRFLMWQFSDGKYTSAGLGTHMWDGAGYCDTSVFYGSISEFKQTLGVGMSTPDVPSPVLSFSGSGVDVWTVYSSTDDQGRGFYDARALADASKIIGGMANASDPVTSKYPAPVSIQALQVDNFVRFVVVGAVPSGIVQFKVGVVK